MWYGNSARTRLWVAAVGMLDRSCRWCTYLVLRVVTILTLALLLMLVLHDTAVVFQYQCLVHHVLEIYKVLGLQCIS
jgi:hypothetical protein